MKLIERSFTICKDHFGFSKVKGYHTMLAINILVLNILQALILSAMTTSLKNLNQIIDKEESDNTKYAYSLGSYIGLGLAYSVFSYFRSDSFFKLYNSLSNSLSSKLINQWTDSAYIGFKFLPKDVANKLYPAQVIACDTKNFSRSLIWLFDTVIKALANFTVAIIKLWQLSIPFTVSIFGISINIHGHLALAAISYSFVYYWVSSKIEAKIEKLRILEQNIENNFFNHIRHIDDHANLVAIRGGGQYERNSLNSNLQEVNRGRDARIPQTKLFYSFVAFHERITAALGFIFSIPQILNHQIKSGNLLVIAGNFSQIAGLSNWKNQNYDYITNVVTSGERISYFTKQMLEAKELIKHRDLVHIPVQDKLSINFAISNQHGVEILRKTAFEFSQGKIYLLKGSSGCGKTVLLQAIAGVWPYVTGKITMPVNNGDIYFISHKPYFPHNARLIDVIRYPDNSLITHSERAEITKLMEEFHFKKDTILALEENVDWDKITLNNEEQQIISIISLLTAKNKPKFVFMDGATSALSVENKKHVEQLLKQLDVTICYIDHNPTAPITQVSDSDEEQNQISSQNSSQVSSRRSSRSGSFADYELSMKDQGITVGVSK